MSIIIQSIEVEWTKQSRGAPYATYRNAVPEYILFGKVDLKRGVYVQRSTYSEYNDFSKPTVKPVKKVNEQQLREMKLAVIEKENTATVFSWGIPLRNDYPKAKRIGDIKEDSWLKIAGNVRIALEYTWVYRKYVYNIFYGNALRFDASVSKTKPTIEYRDEVNLW